MLLELGLELNDLGLELLHVGKQSEDGRSNSGGSRLPVRWWNAEGRCKLAHGASMKEFRRPVKGAVSS